MRSAEEPEQKKVYEPPVLTVYGTIYTLTQAVGTTGQHDSATHGIDIRTHHA